MERRRGGRIWAVGDKGRVVGEVLGGEGGRSVFVGDGVTDLEALLVVDVGVYLRGEGRGRGQRELRECLERVGVECGWSGEYGEQESEGRGKRLWWTRGFEELCDSPLCLGLLGEDRR